MMEFNTETPLERLEREAKEQEQRNNFTQTKMAEFDKQWKDDRDKEKFREKIIEMSSVNDIEYSSLLRRYNENSETFDESNERILESHKENINSFYLDNAQKWNPDYTKNIFKEIYIKLSEQYKQLFSNIQSLQLLIDQDNKYKSFEILANRFESYLLDFDEQYLESMYNGSEKLKDLAPLGNTIKTVLLLNELGVIDLLKGKLKRDNKKTAQLLGLITDQNAETILRNIRDIHTGSKNDPYQREENREEIERRLITLNIKGQNLNKS